MVITFLASFLIWLLFAGLAYLWIIDGRIKKEVALHAFLATLVAVGAAELLKILFPTARPFVTEHLSPLTLTIPHSGSFPSSHTAAAFALAFSVWRHNKKIGTAFLATALTIGIARIAAAVHWPLDILCGAIIGIVVSLAVERLHVFPLLKKHR